MRERTVGNEGHLPRHLQGALQEVTDGEVPQVDPPGDLWVRGTVTERDIVFWKYHLHINKPSLIPRCTYTSNIWHYSYVPYKVGFYHYHGIPTVKVLP